MSTEKTQAEKDISYTGEEGTKHEKDRNVDWS
jgi:hypothetical protein